MKTKILLLVGCLCYSIPNLLYSQQKIVSVSLTTTTLEEELLTNSALLQHIDVVQAKEKAMQAYQQAKIAKDNLTLLKATRLLGDYYHQLGLSETALSYLRPAMTLPNDSEVMATKLAIHNRVGVILLEQGDFTTALSTFQHALKIETNPTNNIALPLTHYYLAQYFIEKKDIDKAITYFDKAVTALQSSNAELKMGYLYLVKGHLRSVEKDYFNAIEYLKKSLSIFQQKEMIYQTALVNTMIGQVHYQEQRYEAALQFSNTAIKTYEGLQAKNQIVAALNQKGQIELKMKEAEKALATFEIALSIAKNQETPTTELNKTHRLLYLALTHLGQLEEAHLHLRKHQVLEETQHHRVNEAKAASVVKAKFRIKEAGGGTTAISTSAEGGNWLITLVLLLCLLGFGALGVKRLVLR